MKHQMWRFIVFLLLIGTLLFGPTRSVGVLAQEPETVFITSPAEGETLSGSIVVTGAVDFSDFVKYEIFLQAGEQLAWVATGYAPVINGNLARLDTRLFLDGTYQLVIRKVNSDSNYTDSFGPTITLNNGLGSPLSSPEIESSFLYPPVSGALFRVRNCSGHNLEFDYKSRQGFCSAQDLWIMYKPDDHPFCPSMDVLLIPCPYEGSAIGEGQPVGATYSFVAEEGKIYEFTYAGDGRFFLGEVAGDERAPTDTGGEATTIAAQTVGSASPASAPAATPSSQNQNTLLPVSGQERVSNLTFVGVAAGLIFFLIIGGVIAVRKRSYLP